MTLPWQASGTRGSRQRATTRHCCKVPVVVPPQPMKGTAPSERSHMPCPRLRGKHGHTVDGREAQLELAPASETMPNPDFNKRSSLQRFGSAAKRFCAELLEGSRLLLSLGSLGSKMVWRGVMSMSLGKMKSEPNQDRRSSGQPPTTAGDAEAVHSSRCTRWHARWNKLFHTAVTQAPPRRANLRERS